MPEKLSRAKLKQMAQEALMHGVANQLGYYNPNDFGEDLTEKQRAELREVMQREADRVARLFGYESAWSN